MPNCVARVSAEASVGVDLPLDAATLVPDAFPGFAQRRNRLLVAQGAQIRDRRLAMLAGFSLTEIEEIRTQAVDPIA